jgi:RNA polymerase sigma-B factor
VAEVRASTSSDPTGAGESRRQTLALFERYAESRDPALRDALVRQFMPLALHLARRYRGHGENDDLVQVASLGLLKAIERFDPSFGTAFATFAVPTIAGELRRYFRDHGWAVRVPRSIKDLAARLEHLRDDLTSRLGRPPTPAELAEASGASVEQVLEALDTATAYRPLSLDTPHSDGGDTDQTLADLRGVDDPGFTRVENSAFVDHLLAPLSEREQTILRLRFQDDLTQAEIGARVGVSQMHVSRVIRQAIARLQSRAERPLV